MSSDAEPKKHRFNDPKVFSKYFVPSDFHRFIRCYTTNFPKNLLENGISRLVFSPKRTVSFFFHSFGMFFGAKLYSQRYITINPAKETMLILVENEIYQVLSSN